MCLIGFRATRGRKDISTNMKHTVHSAVSRYEYTLYIAASSFRKIRPIETERQVEFARKHARSAEFLRLLFYHFHRKGEEFFRSTDKLAQPNQHPVISKRGRFLRQSQEQSWTHPGQGFSASHIMAKAAATWSTSICSLLSPRLRVSLHATHTPIKFTPLTSPPRPAPQPWRAISTLLKVATLVSRSFSTFFTVLRPLPTLVIYHPHHRFAVM